MLQSERVLPSPSCFPAKMTSTPRDSHAFDALSCFPAKIDGKSFLFTGFAHNNDTALAPVSIHPHINGFRSQQLQAARGNSIRPYINALARPRLDFAHNNLPPLALASQRGCRLRSDSGARQGVLFEER